MEMLTKTVLDRDLLEGGKGEEKGLELPPPHGPGGTLTLPSLNIQQLQPGAQGLCLHVAFAGILPVAVHPLGS